METAPPDALLDPLNPSQREAVTYGQGPLLVIAGAGSGKTRVLTHRIAYLVERVGVDPREIMALTFTNKAAREMGERVEKLLGPKASHIWLGTFHSIALRILRRHGDLLPVGPGFAVYDVDDQKRLGRKIIQELRLDPKKFSVTALISTVGREKDEGRGPDEALGAANDRWSSIVREFYRLYQKKLREAKAMDFADLLGGVLNLFARHPEIADQYSHRFKHLLIDEYQDTNRIQYLLAKRISSTWGNLAVVGDEDQSIYGWRGADVGNILTFEEKFKGTKVVVLEQNYRSTSLILDAAGSVIRVNSDRRDKTLWTDRKGGDPVRLFAGATEEEEAAWISERIFELQGKGIPPSEIAVLYRTHALSRPIEDSLLYRSIPYRVFGGLRFYERREIKDLLSYLRLTVNPGDPVALYRVINNPPRGIGDKTMEKLAGEAAQNGVDLWQAATQAVEDNSLGQRASRALLTFISMVEEWRRIAQTTPVATMLEKILADTNYRAEIEKEKDGRGLDRLENIEELLNAARVFDEEDSGGVSIFLDRAALVTDMDRGEGGVEAVTLMTIHSAKGLEFKAVFIAGMEEGVFPHTLSSDTAEGLEEERRLCYVAMTRAAQMLFISRSRVRRVYGAFGEARLPSRFLGELPPEIRPRDIPAPPSFNSSSAPFARAPERPKSAPTWGDRQEPPPSLSANSEGTYFLPEPLEALYKAGMTVRHARYGEGKVLEVSGTGPMARLAVRFLDGSTRKFVAGPAALEIRTD